MSPCPRPAWPGVGLTSGTAGAARRQPVRTASPRLRGRSGRWRPASPAASWLAAGVGAVCLHFYGYAVLFPLPARPDDALGRDRLLCSNSCTRRPRVPGTEGCESVVIERTSITKPLSAELPCSLQRSLLTFSRLTFVHCGREIGSVTLFMRPFKVCSYISFL